MILSSMALPSLPQHVFSEIVRYVCLQESSHAYLEQRLVSRLFNHEILYQCFVRGTSVPSEVKEPFAAGRRYNNLIARRLLQGELKKAEFQEAHSIESGWKVSMLETLRVMRMQSIPRMTAASPWYPQNLSWINETDRLNGMFDDPVSITLCDAVVSYHTHRNVYEAVTLSRLSYSLESWPVACWLLLVACFTGDLDFVRKTSGDVHSVPDSRHFLSASLNVASREGHIEVVSYLLDHGAVVNYSGHFCQCGLYDGGALESAVRSGHLEVMKLLLCPRYMLDRSGTHYHNAIGYVKSIVDQNVRLTTARLLLAHGVSLRMPWVGGSLLYAVCKFNDVELAALALSSPPLRVYSHYIADAPKMNMFHIAVKHGHLECVQLLLRNRHLFEHQELRELRFWSWSYEDNPIAYRYNLSHGTIPDDDRGFCLVAAGAAIGGGVEGVDKIYGLGDLKAAYIPTCPNLEPNHEHTLGSEALRIAVERGRLSNVKYLLELGVRTDKEIAIGRSILDSESPVYEDIQQLLTEHGNAGWVLS